jgi:hypothetical protein
VAWSRASRGQDGGGVAVALELSRTIILAVLAALAIFVALPALIDLAHAGLP